MSTTWQISLGFDWDALTSLDASGNNVAYLQYGILNATTNEVATLNNVQQGDVITFCVYDVTALNDGGNTTTGSGAIPSIATPPSGWTGTWFWNTGTPADPNTQSSPFDNGVYTTLRTNSTLTQPDPPTVQSVVFNGETFQAWNVTDTSGAIRQPAVAIGTLANYVFSLRIWAAQPQGSPKFFEVDPQMIVNP